MEHLSQYIEADYAVLSAVLYCLGKVLKALGRFPNRLIPLTLTGCGIALAFLGAASRWPEYANWAGVMFDGVVILVMLGTQAISFETLVRTYRV